ncbi:5'(3')-deoxyribonucleotidase [Bacillus phage AR9]|uniref:5'(3')-deoxyribonucleotidase n=1 Tax=Bacillus phage AR9 TaxID=1815509 RepID=A0A172JI46_BPPB1|nr:5'(3')-deoxyribonucleotidase [Bacillus phage AR9]AMS01235.1 5'(3')-deoxyribonucleotidase [Bacillus phage AR9]
MFSIKEPFSIVTDCDEVLTDISPLWVHKIQQNADYFGKYFDLSKLEGLEFGTFEHYQTVLSRPEFHLNKWLRKENLVLSDKEEKELFERFYSLYDNDEFYEDCMPTKMCEGIYKLSLQKFVDKIYVVTRTSEGTKEGKRKFIETFLNSNKVEIIFVGKNEKKSDYIKNLKNVKMIVEDELSNINDIVENCNDGFEEVDIYIPSTGYNNKDIDGFNENLMKKGFNAVPYVIIERPETEEKAV